MMPPMPIFGEKLLSTCNTSRECGVVMFSVAITTSSTTTTTTTTITTTITTSIGYNNNNYNNNQETCNYYNYI